MADEITFRFAKAGVSPGELEDRSTDPRIALMACCVATQQAAGFRDLIDIREARCPVCGSPGFNTGWGVWRFTCDAEYHPDGEVCEPCPAEDHPNG